MKIVRKRAQGRPGRTLVWLLAAIASLAVGLWLGQAGALNSLRASLDNLATNLSLTSENSLPVLALDINFENYNALLQQREQALAAGVLFEEDAAFYPAIAQLDGQETPIRLRLLPQAARHLGENDKWNLELETRDNQELLGQQRLNLLDPADNNWLAEWAFAQTLRREELPAATYDFVQLVLNGGQRGIYAVQEAARSLLSPADAEPAQVVVGYDTAALWDAVAYFGGDLAAAVADPVTNFAENDLRFLPVGEGDDPLVTDDPVLAAQQERARALLLGLQRGELAAAEVFDAEAYGRFLALADLWGASAALSPFNLRYAYDPTSDQLTPIGFNAAALGNDDRVPLATTYSDAQIQEAYARWAAHYSTPGFLGEVQAALGPELAALARSMGRAGTDQGIWEQLAERQALLRRSLQPAQPVIAQLGPPERAQEAIIEVNVASTLNLPLEIMGFDIDGATFLEVSPAWITSGEDQIMQSDGRVILAPAPQGSGFALNFVTFELPVTQIIAQDSELDFLNEMEVQVATRVLGLEATQLTPAASGVRTSRSIPATAVP